MEKRPKNSKKRPKKSTFKPLSTIFAPYLKIQGGLASPAPRCRRPWMLGPGKPLQNPSIVETFVTGAYKGQVWIGTGVPAFRVEASLGLCKPSILHLH